MTGKEEGHQLSTEKAVQTGQKSIIKRQGKSHYNPGQGEIISRRRKGQRSAGQGEFVSRGEKVSVTGGRVGP